MKELIAFVAFSLLAMGAATAYAEEQFSDRVEIPWEWTQRMCGENSHFWICTWNKNATSPDAAMDAIFNGTELIPDVKEVQTIAVEEEEPVVEIIQEKPPKLTEFEKDLEKFKNDPPGSNAESEYYELLKNLALCQRGIAESRGVQTTEEFEISYTWVNDGIAWAKALDYTGNHARLKLAIEECQAIRTVLNPVVLGPEYYVKGQYFGKVQSYHGDLAKDVPTWSQNRVNEEANADVPSWKINSLTDLYCGEETYYSKITKDLYCEEKVWITGGGGIPVYSDALTKYRQFQQDGGDAMHEELKRKVIAEKMKELLK